MNGLDVLLIALLLLPALLGVVKGLVNVALTFVGIWAAFLLAPLGRRVLGPPLGDWTGSEPLGIVLGYGLAFVATVLAAGALAWAISRSLEKLDLQWANRAAGAVIGAACGVLLSGAVVGGLRFVAPDGPLLADSLLAAPIGTATGFLVRLSPPEAPAPGEVEEPPASGTEEGTTASRPRPGAGARAARATRPGVHRGASSASGLPPIGPAEPLASACRPATGLDSVGDSMT